MMIRFVAHRYQSLTCRSREIRQGESTFLESQLLCHDAKGLICFWPTLGTSLLPSNCNQSSSQTAIKVPLNILIFAISWCKFFESPLYMTKQEH